jgi:hypothetical protein
MAKGKQANYKQTSFFFAQISTEETLKERFFSFQMQKALFA